MTQRQMNTYHRPDGVSGCGYVIEWGGLDQHSVSWPDRPAERYRDEDLEDWQITVKQVAIASFKDRVITGVTVDEAGKVDLQTSDLQIATTPETPSPGSLPPIPEPGEPASIAPFDATASEADNIRIALGDDPAATNRQVIDRLHKVGINVSSSQISRVRSELKKIAEMAAAAASEKGDGEATEQPEGQGE